MGQKQGRLDDQHSRINYCAGTDVASESVHRNRSPVDFCANTDGERRENMKRRRTLSFLEARQTIFFVARQAGRSCASAVSCRVASRRIGVPPHHPRSLSLETIDLRYRYRRMVSNGLIHSNHLAIIVYVVGAVRLFCQHNRFLSSVLIGSPIPDNSCLRSPKARISKELLAQLRPRRRRYRDVVSCCCHHNIIFSVLT
jgi:hypothetical protein